MKKIFAVSLLSCLFSVAIYAQGEGYIEYNSRKYPVNKQDIKTSPTIRIRPVDEEKLKGTRFPMALSVDGISLWMKLNYDNFLFSEEVIREGELPRFLNTEKYKILDSVYTVSVLAIDSLWVEPFIQSKRNYIKERLQLLDESVLFIENINDYKGKVPIGEMQQHVFNAFKDLHRGYNLTWSEGNNLKNREIIANLIKKKKFVKGLDGEPRTDLLEKIQKEKRELIEITEETDIEKYYYADIPERSLPMEEEEIIGHYGKMWNGRIPMKQLVVQVENPFLLPATDIKNPNYVMPTIAINQANYGKNYETWGWIKEDRLERKKVSYPVEEVFYISTEHPGVKIYGASSDTRYAVKNGKLEYVLEAENWSSPVYKDILSAIKKAAYKANLYGVHKENELVQKILKIELGIEETISLGWIDLLSAPTTDAIFHACERLKIDFTKYMSAASKADAFMTQLDNDFGEIARKAKSVQVAETSYSSISEDGKVELLRTYYLENGALEYKIDVIKMDLDFSMQNY